MSLSGNTRPTRESSRTAQTVSTSSVLARARELARPRPLQYKREKHADSYVRQRNTGRGARGQRSVVDMDRDALQLAMRGLLVAHDELVALPARDLRPCDRADARRDSLARVRLAIGELEAWLDRQPATTVERESRDLTSRNVDELAALPVGSVVYTGAESLRPHHVAALRSAVERRALVLEKFAPFYYRIAVRVTAAPAPSQCTACGYSRAQRDGRCARCGTQTRAA